MVSNALIATVRGADRGSQPPLNSGNRGSIRTASSILILGTAVATVGFSLLLLAPPDRHDRPSPLIALPIPKLELKVEDMLVRFHAG